MLHGSENDFLLMLFVTEVDAPQFESSLCFVHVASHEVVGDLLIGLISSINERIVEIFALVLIDFLIIFQHLLSFLDLKCCLVLRFFKHFFGG